MGKSAKRAISEQPNKKPKNKLVRGSDGKVARHVLKLRRNKTMAKRVLYESNVNRGSKTTPSRTHPRNSASNGKIRRRFKQVPSKDAETQLKRWAELEDEKRKRRNVLMNEDPRKFVHKQKRLPSGSRQGQLENVEEMWRSSSEDANMMSDSKRVKKKAQREDVKQRSVKEQARLALKSLTGDIV